MKNYILVLVLVFAFACASAHKMNRISVGMSKEEVIDKLGEPNSVAANEGVEYLNYFLSDSDNAAWYGVETPYFVQIKNGKVTSYGRRGDFGTTESPTTKVIIEDKKDIKIEETKKE